MRSGKTEKCFRCLLILILFFSVLAGAQDHRNSMPSFPIGAGERVVVYPGMILDTPPDVTGDTSFGIFSSALKRFIHIDLPVGTTLKRVLGDFVDQDGTRDLTISLVRYSNADGQTKITLRSFDTSGISSSSATDFKQVVSNPLSHTILQGWTYFIEAEWPGGQLSTGLRVGVIKIIYEPAP